MGVGGGYLGGAPLWLAVLPKRHQPCSVCVLGRNRHENVLAHRSVFRVFQTQTYKESVLPNLVQKGYLRTYKDLCNREELKLGVSKKNEA